MIAKTFLKTIPNRRVSASGTNQENVMHKSLLATTALVALVSSTAHASAVETIVVSATRTEQPIERTGTSLTVLSADDLKTQQIIVLSDVLKQVPSLVINRT